MVRLAAVDAAVCRIAEQSFGRKVTVRTVIPGTDHSAEVEQVKFDMRQLPLRDLPDAEFDAELARLRAERDRIAALPAEPDRIAKVELDQTYWDQWSALDPADRGGWLAGHHFTVYADRAGVRIEQTFPGLGDLLDGVQYGPWSDRWWADAELSAAA
jgi:hypothetical protein